MIVLWDGTPDRPMGSYLAVPEIVMTTEERRDPFKPPQCREGLREAICALLRTPLSMRQIADRLDCKIATINQQLSVLQKRGVVMKAGKAYGENGRREWLYAVKLGMR